MKLTENKIQLGVEFCGARYTFRRRGMKCTFALTLGVLFSILSFPDTRSLYLSGWKVHRRDGERRRCALRSGTSEMIFPKINGKEEDRVSEKCYILPWKPVESWNIQNAPWLVKDSVIDLKITSKNHLLSTRLFSFRWKICTASVRLRLSIKLTIDPISSRQIVS